MIGAQHLVLRDALAGGGGGGGDSGFRFGDAENGADGEDEDPVDGMDGLPGDEFTGLGGEAGQSGFARSNGTAVCIDVLTPNLTKSLSYSWIHNQWADIKLYAAGGGGGGGGGSEGFEGPNLAALEFWPGGDGGDGGRGEDAAGNATVTQTSDVNVTAVCQVEPGIDPPPTDPTECAIFLDVGWVSAANPDWEANGTWTRTLNMTITAGNTVLTVTGGGGTLTAAGTDDLGNPYFWICPDNFDGDIGSFSLDLGGLGVTSIAPGQTASIVVPNNGISSVLAGAPTTRRGGSSSTGGLGGFFGFFADGVTNNDGGVGGGLLGGDGGFGGITFAFDVDGNGTRETVVTPGGLGGDGGDGEMYDEHKDGIYQGSVTIEIN